MNPSTTPAVGYGYADGSANTVRLTQLTYPDGRQLGYGYGSSGGIDDALSRVAALNETSGALASYLYLGSRQVVQLSYPEPGIEMTYLQQAGTGTGDAGDRYTGLDRFGRVVDVRWKASGSGGGDLERVLYGYDAGSNRLWRQSPVAATGEDELYAYDGLEQLTGRQQGTLNSNHTAITGTPVGQEALAYDPQGNWQEYDVHLPKSDQNNAGKRHSKMRPQASAIAQNR